MKRGPSRRTARTWPSRAGSVSRSGQSRPSITDRGLSARSPATPATSIRARPASRRRDRGVRALPAPTHTPRQDGPEHGMAYDVQRFNELTKQMSAYAHYSA